MHCRDSKRETNVCTLAKRLHFRSIKDNMDMVPKHWAIVPFSFIQMVAHSTSFYIVPQFIVYKLCYNTFNQTACSNLDKIQFRREENYIFEKAAMWNALVNFAGFFPSIFIVLPLGAMTDLVSKKKMLLLPGIFSILSCLINLCSSVFITTHMGFIALASFVTCIFGDVHGCIMLCCAYAASANSHNRTLAMAMTMAGVWLGFSSGSLILNYLIRYYGYSIAFLFAVSSLIVDLLYALVFIPPIDDVNDNDNKLFQEEKYSFWSSFKKHTKDTWIHLISFINKHIRHSKDNTVLLLLIAAFFNLASYGGERALISLFLKHSPLSLKEDQIGIYISAFEFSRASGLILLSLVVARYFHISDYTLMFIGTVNMIISYTIISSSQTKEILYLSIIPAMFQSFMSPAVRSKLVKLVGDEEYGSVLSFIAITNVTSELIMSPTANALFAATAKIYSGFSILLMSVSSLVCLGIMCYVVCTKKSKATAANDYQKVSTKQNKNEER